MGETSSSQTVSFSSVVLVVDTRYVQPKHQTFRNRPLTNPLQHQPPTLSPDPHPPLPHKNIVGNPHNLGNPPITFTRQVIALCVAPWLLDDPRTGELFPSDVIERARSVLATFAGGVGAYTDSRGNLAIRQEVAEFIERRDGYPANPEVR